MNVPKTDAETITDSMIRHQLPLSNCRGQAYDSAANMSGHISGVAARIRKRTSCFVCALSCPQY